MNEEKEAKDYEQARNELWEMLEIWVEKLGPLAGILLMETAVCIWVGIEGEDKTRQAFDGLLARHVGKQASCAREEAPPVDYEKARKLMAWDEGGEA
tara:strand:- start:1717 stop:2007 length:291 start_codon:yes stop_codon:yes gene_type:complete